jgi:uncharacterized RDD family membrane protein YckC
MLICFGERICYHNVDAILTEASADVRCPACGFVSFPDVERCKKCGYRFDDAKVGDDAAPARPAVGEILLSGPHTAPVTGKLPSAASDGPWIDEIPERVAAYRRRRAGTRGRLDDALSPRLDFGAEAQEESQPLAETNLDAGLTVSPDVDLARDTVSLPSRRLSSEHQKRRVIELEETSAPGVAGRRSASKRTPIIVHEPVFRPAESAPDEARDLPVASFGQRFLAGIADCAILLLCGGLFAGIFVASGGHLRADRASYVIVGLVGSALVFGYFGAFAAITHATPGHEWMGISIRNLAGEIPTTGQSLLRAFGYLVAAAAFMIGFLWILMDGSRMGWHDHMSGTLALTLGGPSRSAR